MKSTSPQSQIAIMSGVTPADKTPQSQVARYVHGDIAGGESAHAFRMSVITTAIMEALKGNVRNVKEASYQAAGKTKKARAYLAGFQSIVAILDGSEVAATDDKGVRLCAYKGKYDAKENEAVRVYIDGRTAHYAALFSEAFMAVMDAPRTVKAKAVPAVAPATEASTEASTAAPATEASTDAPAVVEVGLTMAVEAVVEAIQQGVLDSDEYTLLRAALAAYDAAHSTAVEGSDAALHAMLTATPVLLSAQAH